MSYRILVEELKPNPLRETDPKAPSHIGTLSYEQIVEEIDLRAVMQAVNQKKRGPRVQKKDAK